MIPLNHKVVEFRKPSIMGAPDEPQRQLFVKWDEFIRSLNLIYDRTDAVTGSEEFMQRNRGVDVVTVCGTNF